MDAYHKLQTKFAEFHELLGNTIQQQADRAEQQETAEHDLNARCRDVEKRESRVSRIRHLESVNGRMREEIETLRSELTGLNEDGETIRKKFQEDQKRQSPEVVIQDITPNSVPFETYAELARFYADLYKEKSTLVESYSVVAAKLKRCKAKFREWDRFFERDAIDIIVNGERVVFKKVGAAEPSSNTNPRAAGGQQNDESPNLPEIPRRRQRKPEASAGTPTRRRTSDEDPPSTQSQDSRWPVEESLQVSEGFSDAPTIVASRSIRKTISGEKGPPSGAPGSHDSETGSLGRPITVKSENSSSASVPRAALAPSSSDAVEEGPREPSRPVADDRAHHPDAAFPVFQDQPQPDTEPSVPPERSQRNTEPPATATATKRRALQPLDDNSAAQRANVQGVKRRKNETRGAVAVPSVAEDGEDEAANKTPRGRATSGPAKNNVSSCASTGGRLLKLLGEPAGPKPILTPSPRSGMGNKAPPVQPPTTGESTTTPVARHDRASGGDVAAIRTPQSVSSRRGHAVAPNIGKNTDGASPEAGPYRARPVNRLGLHHFKINAERNQGLDFPFQEVIRNKEERKCLSGCVRPGCCGPIFRSMAIEGRLGRPGIPEPVSLEDLDQDDRQLLEEFLGQNKDTLVSMPNSELRELLIDARARDLADQYGRHRYSHEKARTPPGFWRTDMPSTQEARRDQERAGEMDRVRVMERYREAMRPEGLWMFADE